HRRLEEMEAASLLLEEAGVEPIMARATAEHLRGLLERALSGD
ncbi:DUF1932 domain-containing protein, partial [Acinetobacter baumannii]